MFNWVEFIFGSVISATLMIPVMWLISLWGKVPYKIALKKSEENPLKATEEFLSNIREAIVDQILNKQPRLFEAIAKQRSILANQDRDPIAIFLNPEIFKELLRNALGKDHFEEVENLYKAIHALDMPIGHLGDLPIYVTPLLTRAPVFVAGGINWTI